MKSILVRFSVGLVLCLTIGILAIQYVVNDRLKTLLSENEFCDSCDYDFVYYDLIDGEIVISGLSLTPKAFIRDFYQVSGLNVETIMYSQSLYALFTDEVTLTKGGRINAQGMDIIYHDPRKATFNGDLLPPIVSDGKTSVDFYADMKVVGEMNQVSGLVSIDVHGFGKVTLSGAGFVPYLNKVIRAKDASLLIGSTPLESDSVLLKDVVLSYESDGLETLLRYMYEKEARSLGQLSFQDWLRYREYKLLSTASGMRNELLRASEVVQDAITSNSEVSLTYSIGKGVHVREIKKILNLMMFSETYQPFDVLKREYGAQLKAELVLH